MAGVGGCSPYSDASIANGSPALVGGCDVTYSAVPYTAYLTLTGTLAGQTSPRLLVGQDLNATVTLGFTYSTVSYAWSVSGGKPYKTFDEAADQSHGEYLQWVASDYNSSASMDVFFDQADASGATVSVTVTTAGPDLVFTLTQDVVVDAPALETFDAEMGTMQLAYCTWDVNNIEHIDTSGQNPPNYLTLFGASSPMTNYEWGMFLSAAMCTPAIYQVSEGAGQWAWVQLVTRKDSYTSNGQPADYPGFDQRGLDVVDPYQVVTAADSLLRISTLEDAPGEPLVQADQPITMDFYADTLEYFMPPPNGIGTSKAAMYLQSWTCGGTVGFDGTSWTISAQHHAFGSSASDVALFPPGSGEDTSLDHHMGWHRKIT